jgi:hypothetical protein
VYVVSLRFGQSQLHRFVPFPGGWALTEEVSEEQVVLPLAAVMSDDMQASDPIPNVLPQRTKDAIASTATRGARIQ